MTKILSTPKSIGDGDAIEMLIGLLREEIAAIDKGDMERVVELYPKKSELLEKLESESLEIEARYTTTGTSLGGFSDRLSVLHELIRKDTRLLARMTEATREIMAEIARIRARHSLSGIYSAAGEKHAEVVSSTQQIDQSI